MTFRLAEVLPDSLNFLIEFVNFCCYLTLSLTDFNKNAIPFRHFFFKTRLFIMFLVGFKKNIKSIIEVFNQSYYDLCLEFYA
jgi:hypothetical protein